MTCKILLTVIVQLRCNQNALFIVIVIIIIIIIIISYHIISKSQDYGDVSVRNTTRAPNNMQKLKLES